MNFGYFSKIGFNRSKKSLFKTLAHYKGYIGYPQFCNQSRDLQELLVVRTLSTREVSAAVAIMHYLAQNVPALRLGGMAVKVGAMVIASGTTMNAGHLRTRQDLCLQVSPAVQGLWTRGWLTAVSYGSGS